MPVFNTIIYYMAMCQKKSSFFYGYALIYSTKCEKTLKVKKFLPNITEFKQCATMEMPACLYRNMHIHKNVKKCLVFCKLKRIKIN